MAADDQDDDGDVEDLEDLISERAYQLWLSPGSGTAEENWLRAEAELRADAD